MSFSKTDQRPGVDAGWQLLFAFSRARPRATQAGRKGAYGLPLPDGYTSSSGLVASPNLGRRTLSLSNIVK